MRERAKDMFACAHVCLHGGKMIVIVYTDAEIGKELTALLLFDSRRSTPVVCDPQRHVEYHGILCLA